MVIFEQGVLRTGAPPLRRPVLATDRLRLVDRQARVFADLHFPVLAVAVPVAVPVTSPNRSVRRSNRDDSFFEAQESAADGGRVRDDRQVVSARHLRHQPTAAAGIAGGLAVLMGAEEQVGAGALPPR